MATSPSTTTDDDAEIRPIEDIIEEHRGLFETIANSADDPDLREKYGRKPLRHLNQQGDE